MQYWWLFPIVGGFLLTVGFVPLVRSFAVRKGIVDRPDGQRKRHGRTVPLLGGWTIYAAIALVTMAVLWSTDHFTGGDMGARHLYGYVLGGAILMIGGYLDDRYTLRPRQSILFPLLATVVVIAFGLDIEKVTNPTGGAFEIGQLLSHAFVFLWVMGMTYTTKFLDGIDGLATGIGAIASLLMAGLALTTAFYQPDIALLALIVSASLGGFLLWNWHPAHIFLGESGSTFIGYTIAVLAVISGSKVATALLVLGIPILDVLFVLMERWRSGKPLRQADRSHLHFKLFDHGLGQRSVALLYYVLAALFGVSTLIFTSWQKVMALGLLFLLMLFTFLWLPKKEHPSRA
jgi:UDP-GlcNAc:undecaprenyl-phosphate GlcNAc-1-phosphate transferase